MLWFFAALVSLVFDSATALLYRGFAKRHHQDQFIVNALMGIFGVVPIAIIWCFLSGGLMLPSSWQTIFIIIVASGLFVVGNSLIYIANTKADASLIAILYTIKPLTVIILAAIFLGEVLGLFQLIGASIIIVAGLLLVTSTRRQRGATKGTKQAIWLQSIGAASVGVGAVVEKVALNSTVLSTYAVLGWGLQCLIMGVMAIPGSQRIRRFTFRDKLTIILLGILHGLSGVAFIYAVQTSNSVPQITTIVSARVVLIALGGYIFLRERRNVYVTVVTAAMAMLGVIFLAR